MAELGKYYEVTLDKPDTVVCPGKSITKYLLKTSDAAAPKGACVELTKTVFASKGAPIAADVVKVDAVVADVVAEEPLK